MIRTAETSNGWVVSVGPLADHALSSCLRGQTPPSLADIAWVESPQHAAPLQLLSWRHRFTPLIGRDADRQALLDWARGGVGVRARALAGDHGSGKTRLAAEVAETLQQEGWAAGFVGWTDGRTWRAGDAGTLLILDDPFEAEGECWDAVERAMREGVDMATLRVLVLSRRFWWNPLENAKSRRAGDAWNGLLRHARRSGGESAIEWALYLVGESQCATVEDRIAAFQALADMSYQAGRRVHQAAAFESIALLVPLDEAIELVHHAAQLRAAATDAAICFPSSDILEQLFERLKGVNREAALLVARLQVADRRMQKVSFPVGLARNLFVGKCLENVAASAEAAEAREALREAVALYREVYEGTAGRMGEDRLRRAEAALQELEGRQP